MFKKTTLLLCVAALSGCGTSYHRENFLHPGYSDFRVSQDRFCVTFAGNRHTTKAKAEQYALLRAAELTQNHGYTHFAVLGSDDDSNTSLEQRIWSLGTVTQVKKPRITVRIQCFGERDERPLAAICAADYLLFNRPD
jgi:hypothetical protein